MRQILKGRKGAATGLAAVVLAVPLALGFGGGAQAAEMRIAIGQPETHSHSYGLNRYAEYIEENTDIDTKVYQMSLLNLSEIPDGLRDGIVGMGNVVTAYKPAEYSEFNLIANLSMLATLGDVGEVPAAAMSGAVMEYTLFDCPECLAQFKAQNQVFLGSASTSPYILLCREPVKTLADLAGKKLRSGAANFGRWAEHVDGVKVSLPGNEIYDALSQGVVDCAMLSVTTLIEASHIDVTKALLFGVPGGVFAGLADNAVNRDVWQGLTDAEREVLIKGTAGLVADIVMYQRETELKAIELAKEKGLEIAYADDETMADYEAFVKDDLSVIAQEMSTQYGIADTDAKIATASALIEKWIGLTKDIGSGDVDALSEIYWTELLSKLDPSTYAMQ
jgi:TRAP-type C4-dicarboxylate transport system substrate-binding protein